MFFVSLLLNQVVGWMRTQSGTTSLRAILYIDEVFGYLPPVANPPSKLPLLTLMKQARAFGVGVTLVTQNPVDLDYKALSNTGTWFIGRLQTDRDKIRILDALDGASAGSGQQFDRARMDQLIAGLESRVFLMHNVHDDGPVVLQSRWAMSYLRGPLTREQIKTLMDPVKSAVPVPRASTVVASPSPTVPAAPVSTPQVTHRPVLPPEITEYFLRPLGAVDSSTVYRPMVLSISQVRFVDSKKGVDVNKEMFHLAPLTTDPVPLSWDAAQAVPLTFADLEKNPRNIPFADLPPLAAQPKSYGRWQRELEAWLVRSQTIDLFYSPSLQSYSKPEEKESDFRIRMQLAARERTDQGMEKLRTKYAPKYSALDERIRKAQVTIDKEEEQVRRQKYQVAASIGGSILGAVVGRRSSSTTSKTARELAKSSKEKKDVEHAEDNLEALQKQRRALEEEFQQDIKMLSQRTDPLTEKLEMVSIKPTKTNVTTKLLALVWNPQHRD